MLCAAFHPNRPRAVQRMAAKPFFRSSRISSMCSSPTDRRISPGVMPAATSCSSVSWRWVLLAGCSTQVRDVGYMDHHVGKGQAVHELDGRLAPAANGKEITPLHPSGQVLLRGCVHKGCRRQRRDN